jgi:hypothetical protein
MAVTIKSFDSTVTSTTATAVGGYTTASGVTAIAIGLTVSNTSTSAQALIDAYRYNGATAYRISGKATPIPPGGSVVIVSANKVTMASGYQIQVNTYATSVPVDAALSIVEIT